MAVHVNKNTVCLCNYVCCSRLVLNKRPFAKVITLFILHDHLRRLAGFDRFGGVRFASLQQEEVIAWLSFLDDLFACRELNLFERVCQLKALVRLHRGEDRHHREKELVLFALAGGGIFHNVVERFSVKTPQHTSLIC